MEVLGEPLSEPLRNRLGVGIHRAPFQLQELRDGFRDRPAQLGGQILHTGPLRPLEVEVDADAVLDRSRRPRIGASECVGMPVDRFKHDFMVREADSSTECAEPSAEADGHVDSDPLAWARH